MQIIDIKNKIELGLKGCTASVDGDGTHFEAVVVYEGFSGKTLIQRHRMVYAALGDSMKSDIHALSIKTHTPQELDRLGK